MYALQVLAKDSLPYISQVELDKQYQTLSLLCIYSLTPCVTNVVVIACAQIVHVTSGLWDYH